MKTVPTQIVRTVLRKLGLAPTNRGDGSSHEKWTTPQGRTCRPKMNKKDMKIGALNALAFQLEVQQVISRRDFVYQVLAAFGRRGHAAALAIAVVVMIAAAPAEAVELKSPTVESEAAVPQGQRQNPLITARKAATELKRAKAALVQQPGNAAVKEECLAAATDLHEALALELGRRMDAMGLASTVQRQGRAALERELARLQAESDRVTAELAQGRGAVEQLLASPNEADQARAKSLAQRFIPQEKRNLLILRHKKMLQKKLTTFSNAAGVTAARSKLENTRSRLTAAIEQMLVNVDGHRIDTRVADAERQAAEASEGADEMIHILDELAGMDDLGDEAADAHEPPPEDGATTTANTTKTTTGQAH